MNDRLDALLTDIKRLENEVRKELRERQRVFFYEVQDRVVHFTDDMKQLHRERMQPVLRYLREARLRNLLTVPVIWMVLLPALLMDLFVTLYMHICFPVYGIPRVRRSDYLLIDRHYLAYLNVIEKLNCLYCSYFNGLIGYVREVAARTEQYWCPIKHARQNPAPHSRYGQFFDYGDAEQYRARLQRLRTDFSDLQEKTGNGDKP